jgi:hypothetical protein
VKRIQQRGTTFAAILGLGLAVSLVLAGCAAPSTGGGTGGNGQSGASDPSGTTDNGLQDYAGKPATFPSDVPIIDGPVVFGVDLGTGWTVVVTTDDIVAAYQDAEGRLAGAGFTSQLSSTTDDGSFGSFDSDKYTVQVTANDSADYGPSVTYVVVLKG